MWDIGGGATVGQRVNGKGEEDIVVGSSFPPGPLLSRVSWPQCEEKAGGTA